MRIDIEIVIMFYMFICAAMLVFNIWYIFRSKNRSREQIKRTDYWKKQILLQTENFTRTDSVTKEHKKEIRRSLVKISELLAYGTALEELGNMYSAKLASYLQYCQSEIQVLAWKYIKRDSMERAYFAYLIAQYWPGNQREYQPIMEILLSFLEDSTVYCRENVLKALYRLGNVQAVENTLQFFNDKGWFHHKKLLSDGLLTFTGDKEELARRLWSYEKNWNEELNVAVITFITGSSDEYKERFIPVLKDQKCSLEIRLAVMRYYQKHIYPPIQQVLIGYLSDSDEDDNLKIVAASVLGRYPGEETTAALKQAICHENWYVRYNAAASLVKLNISEQDIAEIFQGKDRYAKEILRYMLEQWKAGERI